MISIFLFAMCELFGLANGGRASCVVLIIGEHPIFHVDLNLVIRVIRD